MTFKLVHTADWQIGRTFRRFDAQAAGLLEAARLDVIETIAGVATVAGAAHVVVAGDVFDSPDVDNKTIRQTMAALQRAGALTWWLLPGNHDCARPGGLWDRVERLGIPVNVRVLKSTAAVEMAAGVWLLPAPLLLKSAGHDTTAWMDGAVTPEGAVRIGLAHGSVTDFGSSSTDDDVISPQRAAHARLDYLALGDWHGALRVNDRTWYAGTPEPDRYLDNDPGHVLAVAIAGAGAPPVVEQVRTARYTWIEHAVTVSDGGSRFDAIEAEVRARAGPCDLRSVIVKLRIAGRLQASGHAALAAWREGLEAQVRHLELETDGLIVTTGTDDIAAFGGDEAILAIARRLDEISREAAAGGDGDRQAVAQEALTQVFDLTRGIVSEASP